MQKIGEPFQRKTTRTQAEVCPFMKSEPRKEYRWISNNARTRIPIYSRNVTAKAGSYLEVTVEIHLWKESTSSKAWIMTHST